MQLFLGFIFAIIVSTMAYHARSLSRSGAFAAALIGTLVFGLGGWHWAILLLTFFISSSVITRAFGKRKLFLNEKFSKGDQRDAGQVLANGGLAAFFAALHPLFPTATWPWLTFAAVLAAVNADTWATELGVLNPTLPRMITNPKREVTKGTSGGVSLGGTLASLVGAALIGIIAGSFGPVYEFWQTSLIITLSGLAGSLFDSLLGATVQAIYFCHTCNKETEHYPLHICGTKTVQIRGWKWLNNDLVNFACAGFGVLIVLVLTIV